MPPKKKQDDGKKMHQKKKAKDLEDKTFGLKNKNKSKKVQRYVEQVTNQSADRKKQEAMEKRRAAEKKAAEQAKKEALLSAVVVQQKVPFGVDPKSVLCVLFKDGKCTKGDRCKFSHDLNVGRKSAKKDLFTDARAEKEADKMESWDQDKLNSVVKSKHGNLKTTTDIVCKFFIEAVENATYGWFWVCPNGGNSCKYRHALPEGFVLKTKEQRRLEQLAADSAPKFSLEEFIELEKEKLGKNLTPITTESFNKWKKEHQLNKLNEKNRIAANGKRILTGKEVIEQKFKDKLLDNKTVTDDVVEDDEHGTVWDMSDFQKQLREAEQNETFKDYGDGTTINFDEVEEKKTEEKSKEESFVENSETSISPEPASTTV